MGSTSSPWQRFGGRLVLGRRATALYCIRFGLGARETEREVWIDEEHRSYAMPKGCVL